MILANEMVVNYLRIKLKEISIFIDIVQKDSLFIAFKKQVPKPDEGRRLAGGGRLPDPSLRSG